MAKQYLQKESTFVIDNTKNSCKVLLVEDSKIDQLAFQRMVKEHKLNYDYTIASSVAEAKQVLATQQFDIVLVDHDLGDGTAFDIFKLKISAPIIVITGSGNVEVAVAAMKAGAYDYLSKNQDSTHLKVLPLIIETAIQHRQSEQRFQALVSPIPGAIYRCAWDTYWTMDFISDAIADISGYPAADFIQNQVRSFASIIHPDDTSRVEQIIRQAVTLHIPYVVEYRIICVDGNIKWVYEKGQGICSEDTEMICRNGVIFDITERKQTEWRQGAQYATTRVLAEANTINEAIPNILQAICESLGWQLGEYWNITEDNVLRCVETWQVELGQNQGVPQSFSTSITLAPGVGLPGRIWASGTPDWIVDVAQDDNFLRGETAHKASLHSAFGFPIIRGSEILGVLTFFNQYIQSPDADLLNMMSAIGSQIGLFIERQRAQSALQQSEAQLRKQTMQLQQALQDLKHTHAQLVQSEKMSALGQLIAGVAHEINNPVNFINGNLYHTNHYIQDLLNLLRLYQQFYPNPVSEIKAEIDSIELDFLAEDLPQLLNSMKMGTERICEIVQSLRNFSRVDEADKKLVNIHEGIDSALLILRSHIQANQKRSAVKIIKEYGKLPLVKCHVGQLNQVILNILNNALDSLEEQRLEKVEVEADANKSQVTNITSLHLAAPCIRISTELIESHSAIIRISDNGYGMTEEVKKQIFEPFFTTKPVGKGTGLGLSLSYQIIVEKHKGKLHCTSEIGVGTEFLIQIPVKGE